ncbi:MAG: hypothetical protein Roseis2KO_37290 [Roseivirga sp.]
MKEQDYWKAFWTQGNILKQSDPQLRVGRSKMGEPIQKELWDETLRFLADQLDLQEGDRLLDIGAGSGMISIPFSHRVNRVVAADFSAALLSTYAHYENIQTLVTDIREQQFDQASFSKVIIYFALQHFSESETIRLFRAIYQWLEPGGIFYCGDIPDVTRKFLFYNNGERKKAYFDAIAKDKPILGNWFHKEFFNELGEDIGFSSVIVSDQPTSFYNAHYRFDVKFVK